MNTDSLTGFSWSRHQINDLITSGVVENGGMGAIPHASHQQLGENLRQFNGFESDFMYLLM